MVLDRICQYPLNYEILKYHQTPEYLKTTDCLFLSVKFSSKLHTYFSVCQELCQKLLLCWKLCTQLELI